MTQTPSADQPRPGSPGVAEYEPDIEASAIAAVARTRAQGLHYYGQILGITASPPADGPRRPYLAPDRCVTPGPVPPVALATIADLAMGSAIRAAVGAGRRLGTTSMTLHHLRPVVTAPVQPDASVVWLDADRRNGLARADLTDATGALVGAAQGWFMALPVPEGVTMRLLPWELDELPAVPDLAPDELRENERAAVDATLRAGARASARGTSVIAELTALTWDDTSDGTARGALRIGPELGNRVGHVQGGALYGIGLSAAARAVGPGFEPADGHWQFLRPGDGDLLV
ncbi:MAG: PaaI family thioesterase, partial [Actinomycetota bacterium]|nr:PaaI family thioesterase [Actinomycetota bacterium]